MTTTTPAFTEIPGYTPGEHVLAAEKAVIGAALTSAAAVGSLEMLTPRSFHIPQHGLIFAACHTLAEAGHPVDPVTVMDDLARNAELTAAGGANYLHECYAAAMPANAIHHARIVATDHQRRELLEHATSIAQEAGSTSFDPETTFDRARQLIEEVSAPATGEGLRPIRVLVNDVIDSLEHEAERGLPTGLHDLDEALNGLAPGQLIIVGARPGAGKSLLAQGIATHVSVDLGLPALFHSLEMSAEEITLRFLASLARVNLTSLVRHQLTSADWDKLAKAADALGASPLVIDDQPGCSMSHIRKRLREMARTEPARLLIIDYLQLLDAPKAESRQTAVSAIARGLKNLARELGIPVVVAAQLNRLSEQRADKRPILSDLRESGELEAAADVVILLHRDDMHEIDSPRAGEIDLIIDKQRQGPRCVVTASFQGHYARIKSMSTREVAENWSPHAAAESAA